MELKEKAFHRAVKDLEAELAKKDPDSPDPGTVESHLKVVNTKAESAIQQLMEQHLDDGDDAEYLECENKL